MIKIPYNQVVAKIKEESKLSEEEINSKIQEKKEQLAGLISDEGAAHIVANELGVKVIESISGKLQIKNILAGMRDVETVGKALRVYEIREFNSNGRQGKVGSLMIGDESGAIRVVMWGSQADNITNIKENDIIRVSGAYVRENNGIKEIHVNERTKVDINPEGVTVENVKHFQEGFSRPAAKRKKIIELKEQDNNIELLGTVVQAFDPRFFEVCPKCSKRIRSHEGGGFICPEHGETDPDYSYVFNAIVDDGTENIRTVFFRNQMERLIGKTKEEILRYRESPNQFEEVKNDLMGSIVKITGRVNKNDMFDRLEFVSMFVDPNPSAEEEIKNIK